MISIIVKKSIMKVMLQTVLATFFCFSIVFSASADDKYMLFSCVSEKSALDCGSMCSPIGTIFFDARVNNNESSVNVTRYTENEVAPESLEDCIVIDTNNWSCLTESEFQDNLNKMVAGTYFSKQVYRMLDGQIDVTFSCSKKN